MNFLKLNYSQITAIFNSCCLTYGGYPLKSTSPLFGDASELAAYSQIDGFKINSNLIFLFLIKKTGEFLRFYAVGKVN